jgi:hypothetical protein
MIVTGDWHQPTSEAVDWLKEHGAKVEDCNDVTMITLSSNLEVGEGARSGHYVISDEDSGGNERVEVQLDIDVYETMLFVCSAED